jgi:hypothetical protein
MGKVTVGPFYFGTVFWGEEYRNYFLRFCLPSLLSPRNIPALENGESNRFIICTTREDWNACNHHPTFRLLTTYVEPVFIELQSDVLQNRTTMLAMSWGHQAITALSFEAKACGIVVCPDTIISDGSVEALAELVQSKKAVVLAPGLRFRTESLLPLLEARGLVKSGEPLTLSGRELAELALPNMHSETLCYQWETPYLWDPPVSCIWQMPDRSGILLHTFSWAPLLVDYSRLKCHDVDVFENWTMDGDYIHSNFGDSDLIHVVKDSDEVLMVSFTRESVWSLPMRQHWTARFPLIENYRKGLVLRRFMFSDAIDPLKRRIFNVPVRFQTRDVTTAWIEKEHQVRSLLDRIVHPPSRIDITITYVMRLVQQVQNAYSCCQWLFRNRRFVWQRICRRMGLVTNTSNIR